MAITTLEGTVNFRDLGGLPLSGGGTVNSGVLYRSDAIAGLTPHGLEELAGSGISVIVDYRTPAEQQMAPDRLPAVNTFLKLDLPLLEGAFTAMAQQEMQRASLSGDRAAAARAVQAAVGQLPTLGEVYTGMLQHAAPEFAQSARAVSATGPGSATLVHCTAGKDRTGVAVALLLDAVGVETGAIVADYEASERNLAGAWAEKTLGMVTALGIPLNDEIITLATKAPAGVIRAALAWVEENHGSSAEYLRFGGLSDAELSDLRSRLRD
ncbi:tyrosine-protein phosphatase [Arthrobacter caoxuetaonis]|uniref:tyrosine-protein phosphatase n=1 Tax=Arthrobacter caoxuetaonis TaxID=2886935 RepID=UPI001D14FDA5|nr:tyrosine-protein phosphatase [Arthrobacter caoxuetaonis]MCC3283950.1 tyrosine-protein phosphatase [Arthrobacter caoxuetaonis]